MSFNYQNGRLHAENVAVSEIAKKFGTPFYCYSTSTLINNFRKYIEAFSDYPTQICFAVKSNSNINVLKILAELGSGADTVSQGEIMRSLKAGISADKIVFSGVGKTRSEIEYALKQNVGQINAESREEIEIIDKIAKNLGVKAPVSIRVNPDVDANTHEKITTGRKIDKFGIPWEEAAESFEFAGKLENIDVQGVTTHIGSQINDVEPFRKAAEKICGLAKSLLDKGFKLNRIDLGGGLGIRYKDEETVNHKEYANAILEYVKPLGLKLYLEPGRNIAADAGILVSEVQFIKHAGERSFAIIDAGMNDIARPAIYTAYHGIIAEKSQENSSKYDVVGPVCESADIFGRQRDLPELEYGDLIAIEQAGAYGMVMAGTYNTRPMIPEILVDDDSFNIIRRRQTLEELISLDEVE